MVDLFTELDINSCDSAPGKCCLETRAKKKGRRGSFATINRLPHPITLRMYICKCPVVVVVVDSFPLDFLFFRPSSVRISYDSVMHTTDSWTALWFANHSIVKDVKVVSDHSHHHCILYHLSSILNLPSVASAKSFLTDLRQTMRTNVCN